MTKLFFRISDWCLDDPIHIGKVFVWIWLCMTGLAVGIVAILIWLATVGTIWMGIARLFS